MKLALIFALAASAASAADYGSPPRVVYGTPPRAYLSDPSPRVIYLPPGVVVAPEVDPDPPPPPGATPEPPVCVPYANPNGRWVWIPWN